MESLSIIFGKRVRALRESKKWTQDELARAAKLGPKHIGVIERGEKPSSFAAVERIANALDVEYHELFRVQAPRRHAAIEKELDRLIAKPHHIDVSKVEEFLRGFRALLRRLDRS